QMRGVCQAPPVPLRKPYCPSSCSCIDRRGLTPGQPRVDHRIAHPETEIPAEDLETTRGVELRLRQRQSVDHRRVPALALERAHRVRRITKQPDVAAEASRS